MLDLSKLLYFIDLCCSKAIETSQVKDTNLGKAESHCIWVVVLRDEDASHKVSEFVSQTVNHCDHQTQGGHQGLQHMISWDTPSLSPAPWTTAHIQERIVRHSWLNHTIAMRFHSLNDIYTALNLVMQYVLKKTKAKTSLSFKLCKLFFLFYLLQYSLTGESSCTYLENKPSGMTGSHMCCNRSNSSIYCM